MIKSMTGYGGAKDEIRGIQVSAELKSVNNRHLDASVRLPKTPSTTGIFGMAG